MSQDEHENRQIMVVKSLPVSYRGIVSYGTIGNFFETFNFHHMKQEKKENGENDVNAIVLDEYVVQCADCIDIHNKSCLWGFWGSSFGYY